MYTKCRTKTELHSNVTTLYYVLNFDCKKCENQIYSNQGWNRVRSSGLSGSAGSCSVQVEWVWSPVYKYPNLTWVLNLDHMCYYLSDPDQSDELSILDADLWFCSMILQWIDWIIRVFSLFGAYIIHTPQKYRANFISFYKKFKY